MYFANTHMHSTFSDGVYTPEKLIELGAKLGVKVFEVCHPGMSAEEKAFYTEVCDTHGLYKMGGIDHYGILGFFVTECQNFKPISARAISRNKTS